MKGATFIVRNLPRKKYDFQTYLSIDTTAEIKQFLRHYVASSIKRCCTKGISSNDCLSIEIGFLGE